MRELTRKQRTFDYRIDSGIVWERWATNRDGGRRTPGGLGGDVLAGIRTHRNYDGALAPGRRDRMKADLGQSCRE
jgi:hypothetical protein